MNWCCQCGQCEHTKGLWSRAACLLFDKWEPDLWLWNYEWGDGEEAKVWESYRSWLSLTPQVWRTCADEVTGMPHCSKTAYQWRMSCRCHLCHFKNLVKVHKLGRQGLCSWSYPPPLLEFLSWSDLGLNISGLSVGSSAHTDDIRTTPDKNWGIR